ncbi:putative nuclease HARBI1 [Prorops nasuta]|uniref:putative nuclease HARBI1 n=1 Tax=Prorops nasuta TaxID=863751 RepID=UPI0034CE1AD0
MDILCFWNSLFEDANSELEDENIIMLSGKREYHARMANYLPNVVLHYSLSDFKSHFRLSKFTFEALVQRIGPCLLRRANGPKVHPFKQLAIALWIFGNQEVFRSVSDRFDLSKSTIWNCVFNVTYVLQNHAADYIKWPNDYQIKYNIQKFAEISHFPGVIGVIDGCHIPISAPKNHPNSYINRKGFHSIHLQGICDSNRKFIDVFTGYCGSVHDARVWQNSKIKLVIDNECDRYFPNNTHLLGDSAYPLYKILLTPYKDNGHLNEIQINYNRKFCSTRMIIERTFGLLKGRFRKLNYIYMFNTDMIPSVILACCILHNICIENDDDPFESIEVNEDDEEDMYYNNNNDIFVDGEEKRELLATLLNSVLNINLIKNKKIGKHSFVIPVRFNS